MIQLINYAYFTNKTSTISNATWQKEGKKTDDKCVCTKGKHPKKERTSIQKTFDGMLNSLSTQTSSKHMESIFSVQTKHCVVIRDVFVSIKRIKYYFSETIPGHFIYTMHLGLIAIQFDL